MRPAAGFGNRSALPIRRVERIESAVGVGLKDPVVAGQMLLGMNAGSIRRVEEHGGRWRLAEGTVIADIGPDPAGARLSLGQHRHGGVVAMDALGSKDVR